jgi:23S rRNA (uracil1939-C5)-methyltransferase
VHPQCPYFSTCGGCHYQHAPYAYQLDQKETILREVMRRIGKFEAPEHIDIISGAEWQYRNRVQLHQADGRLGYLEAGSHRLCAITQCPISSPRINEVITVLDRMVRDRRFPAFLRTLEIFTNEHDVQLNVLDAAKPVAKRFFEWCAKEIVGFRPGTIEYPAAGQTFRVSPRSFFQVNRFVIDALVNAVLGELRGTTAIDLYAGVGLFSIPLARRCEQVTAVEGSASAAADLRVNVARAGAKVDVHQISVDEYIAEATTKPELLVADPPRAGLGKVVAGHLVRLRPTRIHIVACDPTTLARDLAVLLANGYGIERLMLVDLFPQTYHMETVVHLSAS